MRPVHMLIDDVTITVSGGHGGPGKVSFGRRMGSGPDGGNGGKGGDLYLRVTTDLFALNRFSSNKNIKAQDGEMGASNNRSGHTGADTELALPLGSVLTNIETGEVLELIDPSQRVLITKGGIGGLGNFELRSARNTTPLKAQGGRPGETKQLHIVLKLIAQYGLIGLPNAGKSSLLNELTNAHVKTANYPFTTLETNLGDFNGKIIADIPGLIEGASDGKGLGLKFLKHIEKVSLLLHCIASDTDDPVRDYEVINNELEKYNPELVKKKRVILLTKTDLVDKEVVKKHTLKLKKYKHKTLPLSIHDFDQMQKLHKLLG